MKQVAVRISRQRALRKDFRPLRLWAPPSVHFSRPSEFVSIWHLIIRWFHDISYLSRNFDGLTQFFLPSASRLCWDQPRLKVWSQHRYLSYVCPEIQILHTFAYMI
jgi:hypothetical protein